MKGFRFLFSMLLVMMFTLNTAYAAPDIGYHVKPIESIRPNDCNVIELSTTHHYNLIKDRYGSFKDIMYLITYNPVMEHSTDYLVMLFKKSEYKAYKTNMKVTSNKVNTNPYNVMYRCKENQYHNNNN